MAPVSEWADLPRRISLEQLRHHLIIENRRFPAMGAGHRRIHS
jgi:hypothetical protein